MILQSVKFCVIKCREVLPFFNSLRETCIGAEFGQLKVFWIAYELLLVITQQVSLHSCIGREVWFVVDNSVGITMVSRFIKRYGFSAPIAHFSKFPRPILHTFPRELRTHWRCPCVQIWPIFTFEFSCDNSGSDLHGLLLTCSVCVNPLRVYWSELVLCSVFTFIDFLIHSNVTWICQLLFKSFAHCMPRQFFAGNIYQCI